MSLTTERPSGSLPIAAPPPTVAEKVAAEESAAPTPVGRHFSNTPDASTPPANNGNTQELDQPSEKLDWQQQFNQAVNRMHHDNPLLSVPAKYVAPIWLLAPVAAFANYIVPTRYMRFFWGKVWFMVRTLLPGNVFRPSAPYLPQRAHRVREASASQVAQNVVLHEGKVISVFHFGGGIGKTTQAARLGLQIKKLRPDLTVDIVDCGEGTLVQRFIRNVRNSFLDLLDNLEKKMIEQPSDLARYRTVTPEGIYVTAWRRDTQTRGVRNVTRQEMLNGIRLFAEYSNVVVCDLPYGNGPTHRGVLDGTHQVQLVTIPAADRLDQAVASYGWLIENDYEHLARTAVIVVNRCKSIADLEKVRAKFCENYGAYMDEVRFQPVYFSKNLEKGGKIKLDEFSRRHKAQYAEYGAAVLNELADGKRDNPDSVMTHLEVQNLGIKKELPQRSPHIGSPTPDGGPAQPALEPSAQKE
jgi:MinD-like ATPase involved in chromosome partitioning or flagellar assembly